MVPLLVLGLSPALAGPQDGRGCDMATIVPAYYCRGEATILLERELVSLQPYYRCVGCGSFTFEEGDCGDCLLPRERRISDAGVCPHCLKRPRPRYACEKTCYACPECSSVSAEAGHCEACIQEREEVLSRALVEYGCGAGCGFVSTGIGACEDPACEGFGRPLRPSCTEAGLFPHFSDRH